MRRRGFTLMEVMCVIAIIVLAAILFPIFARVRETARKESCASNLQQIGMALHIYAQDYAGRFPEKNNDFAALHGHIKQMDVLWCPSDAEKDTYSGSYRPKPDKSGKRNDIAYSSYVYKGGLTNDDRRDLAIAGESKLFHMLNVNVLHINGTVTAVKGSTYVPMVKPQPRPLAEPEPGPMPPGMPPPMPPSPGSP